MSARTLSLKPWLGALALALLAQARTAGAGAPPGETRPAVSQNKPAVATETPPKAAPKAPETAHEAPKAGPAEAAKPKAPEPPKAPPPPPAAKPRPAAKCDSATLSASIQELRAELHALEHGSLLPLSSAQSAQRAAYEQELAHEQASHDALVVAIEKGAPKEALAGAIEKSEKHVAELKAKLQELEPTKSAGMDSVPEQVAAIQKSLTAIEAKLATPQSSLEPAPLVSLSAPAPDKAPDAAKPDTAPTSLGLNLDAGLASQYNFRGLNVFKSGSQSDQHAVANPGVSYSPPQIDGLTIAYWGAFQVSGDNAAQLVKQGIGNEQDLTASYGRYVVKEKLQARVGVTNYIYPFADKAVAGTRVPYYFEPWALATYTGPVTATFLATYFYGTQDAIRPGSYAYFRPGLEKSIPISKMVSFVPAAGVGFKAYTHNSALDDNRYDVAVDLKLPVNVSDLTYVLPAVHYAWSNFAQGVVTTEHAVWLSANVGLNL